jgi:AcrR family transcriptional regulator
MSRNTISVPTDRFAARRERILEVGARHIRERGLKGLSLGAVADEIGIGGSSVTYYFRRKDLLAEACFDRSLDALEQQLADAATRPDPRSRIARFIELTIRAASEVGNDGASPLVRLHEMRAMEDPARARLVRRYFTLLRAARGYFAEYVGDEAHLLQVMRSQVLLDTVHVIPDWLGRYAPEEHERVATQLTAILADGIAPSGSAAQTIEFAPLAHEGDTPLDRFLGAATELMNERGYRGASVDRIAAALKVTKGSFYHHVDAKDDLVLACFRRSLDVIGRAQDAALATDMTYLDRLTSAFAALVDLQFGNGTPLLRTTALAALPSDLVREAVDRSEQIARRFAGMVIDGIADGSANAVDPLIAGQVIMSSLNVAVELRTVSRRVPPQRAISLYASTLLRGMAND